MKKNHFLINFIVFLLLWNIGRAQVSPSHYLIPIPVREQDNKGVFVLPKNITYNFPATIQDSLQPLVSQMHHFFEIFFLKPINKNMEGGTITFKVSDTINNSEGYVLQIKPNGISIASKNIVGMFYAWQTLQQILLYSKINGLQTLPCTSIYDFPRYSFRAIMLDPARHFLTIKDLKSFIGTMAFYKFNFLHLHLTDDQGWRVEIKSYPQLTGKGAMVRQPDSSIKPLFYRQEELKDLVKYAQKYFVQIIPEIDIPGHNTALLTVFPDLACFPKKFELPTTPGVSKDILCAANPRVYKVYKEILTEVAGIFPCKYFHLGGDESPLDTWEKSPACQQLIKEKHLKTVQGLMSYFLEKNARVIERRGKIPLFWYELNVPEYPKNSIAYFWRMGLSRKVIEKATAEGHPLIGSPGEYAYFDYPQSINDILLPDWMSVTTLRQVYKFNPTYNFPDSISKNIMGIEACIWGEFVPTLKRAYYQAYPRAMAFAEAGWSQMKNRDWNDFKQRLLINLSFLLQKGINYRPPYECYQQ